jgi:hypothetical protein
MLKYFQILIIFSLFYYIKKVLNGYGVTLNSQYKCFSQKNISGSSWTQQRIVEFKNLLFISLSNIRYLERQGFG